MLEQCENVSTHVYRTTYGKRRICIYAGWDRFLQDCFLQIEFLDSTAEEPLFSFLEDDPGIGTRDAETLSFDRYLRVLDDLGIQLPQEMIRAIEKDINANTAFGLRDWTHSNGQGSRVPNR